MHAKIKKLKLDAPFFYLNQTVKFFYFFFYLQKTF